MGKLAMRSRDFRKSPLKKGDKGGCEDNMKNESQATTPSAPFTKGEFFPKLLTFTVSSGTCGIRLVNLTVA